MKAISAIVLPVVFIMCFICIVGHLWAQTIAFIPNQGGDTVTRVFTADETPDSVVLADSPYGAAVTPRGSYLFVTRSSAGIVTRIQVNSFTSTSTHSDITVESDPRGVAVEPEDKYAYVANFGSDSVSKIDISSRSVDKTISVGNGPLGVAAIFDQTDDTPVVYVTNNLGDNMTVIGDEDATSSIDDLCDGPAGAAATPNWKFVYVACTEDDEVVVIRTSDNTSIESIPVGDEPWGVAVGADGKYVFVTNSADDTVSVIDTSDNEVIEELTVGDQPMGVAAPLNGDFAYVVNQTDNSVHKIDMSTDTPTVTEILVNEVDSATSLGAFIGGTPPAAPSNMEAETVDDNEIELTWSDNSTEESGFKIERREDSVEAFAQVAKVDANATEYTDDELAGATTYHYRVRSYNEAADSVATSSAEATTDEGEFSWCFIGSLR